MTSDVHLQIPSSSPDSYVPCSINSSNYVSISTWAIIRKKTPEEDLDPHTNSVFLQVYLL